VAENNEQIFYNVWIPKMQEVVSLDSNRRVISTSRDEELDANISKQLEVRVLTSCVSQFLKKFTRNKFHLIISICLWENICVNGRK
jgi:hypothetical protein